MNAFEENEPDFPVLKHNILVIGATGLVGSEFLKLAVESEHFNKIYVLSRKPLIERYECDRLIHILQPDSNKWVETINKMPKVDLVFSSLGTTKSAAGGIAAQRAIDHDLNLSIAQAVKLKGTEIFMIITSLNHYLLTSLSAYFRIKKELEDDLIALDFEQLHIFRPGPILGDRSKLYGAKQSWFSRCAECVADAVRDSAFFAKYAGDPITGEQVARSVMYEAETTWSVSTTKVNILKSEDMVWIVRAMEEADY